MRYRTKLAAAALLAASLLPGCGSDLPKTHAVSGRVVLAGGDAKQLAGHHVEAVLATDPNVRASGVIGTDGSFTLETLHAGTILKGVREGTFKVRILRAEEDDDGKKLKKPPVANQYLDLSATPLTLEVPPKGDVTLEVRSR